MANQNANSEKSKSNLLNGSNQLRSSEINFAHNPNLKLANPGFTIVELLVVIVIIGILAAITMVSYSGISNRARIASLQSDLSNASTQLKLFQATEASGNYPTANNCPNPGATEICLKASNGNTFTYVSNNAVNPKVFALNAANDTTVYQITNNSSPTASPVPLLTITDPANWLVIGNQAWAKANLNVGTMIAGATNQTNNSTLEKYCYGDNESNCTTYGGLYQWGEAMQYATTAGAQGICPVGSHVPTDAEWTTLETYFGSATAGTQLKPSGSSGLNIPLAGFRDINGSFSGFSSLGDLWSSLESSTNAWNRNLNSSIATVGKGALDKTYGFSMRCIGN